MATENYIINSPTEWVAEHIAKYVESDGMEGHIWRGVPTLLLTTTGRKTGARRRTALIYGRYDDDYIIVASKGGHPHNPLWYANLEVDADVTLQVGPNVFAATAVTLEDGAERSTAWASMVAIWPAFDEYQAKTSRQIPLVRLRRK